MTTGFSTSFTALVPPALNDFTAFTRELGKSTARSTRIPADLAIVCLWSVVGLVLTGLLASLGFSSEIAQFMAVN